MAVKYRIEYDDIDADLTRIDISDATYAGGITTLVADGDPLQIDLPKGKDIFDPVQGSGGTITVLAKDSDDLRSLYTGDPFKYVITIYKAGTTAADIIFIGYINTSFYSEPFNEYDNYPISIGFNDGIALLGRYDYLNAGSKYTGVSSLLIVVLRAVAQMGTVHKDIRIISDMDYSGYTISNDSILHNLEAANGNYYDESGDPLSFRKVMEGIMEALGLIMFTQGGSLYIADPLMLQYASYTEMVFTASGGTYVSSSTVSPNKGIGVTVEYYRTGTQLDFSEPFSRLVQNYSGYAAEVTESPDWQDKSVHAAEGSWSLVSGSPYGDDYDANTTWNGITGYTLSNGAVWYGTRQDEGYQEEFHATWQRASPSGSGDENPRVAFVGVNPLHYVSGQFIKINFKMIVQTVWGYYNPSDNKDEIFGLLQSIKIKCGDRWWNNQTQSWTLTDAPSLFQLKGDGQQLNDQWTEHSIMIGMSGTAEGNIQVTFDDYSVPLGSDYTGTGADQNIFRIKDVSINSGNSVGAISDDDYEFIGDIDNDWNTEAPSLDLIHGDSSDGNATDRGGFIDNSGSFATGFQYGAMSTWEKLWNVLAKKYGGQYISPRMMLNAELYCSDIYTEGLCKTGNISESVNLAGRKFLLIGGAYHDRDKYISGTWMEILPDTATINL